MRSPFTDAMPESYYVDLRFPQPSADADVRPTHEVGPLRVDRNALLIAAVPADYGRELARQLFTEARVEDALAKARVAAESQNVALRVRLAVRPSAPELHNLHWETLVDPVTNSTTGAPLLANEFSTYRAIGGPCAPDKTNSSNPGMGQ